MQRAFSIITLTKSSESERLIEGVCTSPRVDRHLDIVEPMGGEWKLPLPLLWMHNHEAPVGTVTQAKADATGIRFRARLAKVKEPGPLKDRLDEAWLSIREGLTPACSIGFQPLQYEPLATGGIRYTKWSWHELSICTIPANEDATISAVSKYFAKTQTKTGGDFIMDAYDGHKYDAEAAKIPANGDMIVQVMGVIHELANATEKRLSDLERFAGSQRV